MTTAKEYIQNTFESVKARNAHEAEFLQAVEEFLTHLSPFLKNILNTLKKTFWHALPSQNV